MRAAVSPDTSMRPRTSLSRRILGLLAALFLSSLARADAALHSFWEVHGKHNTVYLLGSIHVLRPSDYPLPQPVLEAYARSKALVMEIDLDELNDPHTQSELLAAATLPEGQSLHTVLGEQRYAHAESLAKEIGVNLEMFDRFAPWFAAEAIEQLQLAQLGFKPESGVEMYFKERARTDSKAVTGLESAADQIGVFAGMPLDTQSEYLIASLEEARELPKDVDAMVSAWRRGDSRWFESELQSEFGKDQRLYETLLGARNRRWLPKIEALLNEDRDYLVIVGSAHLMGRGNVIELLKKDGIGATQR